MNTFISKVYMIRNKITGKFYIGSTMDIKERWNHHLKILRSGRHNSKFQLDWDKYNEDSWEWTILEDNIPFQLQFISEQYWLDNTECYKTGYNVAFKAGSYIPINGDLDSLQVDEQLEQIIDKLKNKIPYRTIALEYGVSLGYLGKTRSRFLPEMVNDYHKLKKENQLNREAHQLKQTEKLIIKQKIAKFLEDGATYREAVKKFNVSLCQVGRIRKEFKVVQKSQRYKYTT